MSGKRLSALEMPEDELPAPTSARYRKPPASFDPTPPHATPSASPASIPLPPIPAAARREIMIQLSIKAPLALVERLETITKNTGAQKQAVLAAALDAYLTGHGY